MTEQEKRIGTHPASDIFSTWLNHEDLPTSDAKKHRKLSENPSERSNAIETLARWIIQHHVSDKDITNLQKQKNEILQKYNFEERLKGKLPVKNKETQKGNASEILFCEYIKTAVGFDSFIFRLRYNPNVEQSMKGDDLLLFDTSNLDNRIIIGESKYRGTPDKSAIEEILDSMGGEVRLPISMSFVESRLRDMGQDKLSDNLADLQIKTRFKQIPVVNIGFFLSNLNAANHIERHHLQANFVITQATIQELLKIGFPTSHIEILKSKIFRTESKLIEAIQKQLEKVNKKNKKDGIKGKDIDVKDVIDKHNDSIHQHCDKSHNPELVFVSLGIDNPENLIELSFQRANEILKNEIESIIISH